MRASAEPPSAINSRSYAHGKRDHAGMGNVRLLRWTSDRESADAQPQPTHDALSAITVRPAGGSTGPLRLARAAAAIGAIAFAVLPCHVALSQWRPGARADTAGAIAIARPGKLDAGERIGDRGIQ